MKRRHGFSALERRSLTVLESLLCARWIDVHPGPSICAAARARGAEPAFDGRAAAAGVWRYGCPVDIEERVA